MKRDLLHNGDFRKETCFAHRKNQNLALRSASLFASTQKVFTSTIIVADRYLLVPIPYFFSGGNFFGVIFFFVTRTCDKVGSWSKMARADTIYSQGHSKSGHTLLVQCTMTKSGDATFAHIQGPAAQLPADAWITTDALHFISVPFCCAACLEVSSALEESPILHRGAHCHHKHDA